MKYVVIVGFMLLTTQAFSQSKFSKQEISINGFRNPSSFYTSVSYARRLTREYKGKDAIIPQVGFRWMVYKGLNLRLGVTRLAAEGEDFKINSTPGISYSFFIR